jgi:hypothetical protein
MKFLEKNFGQTGSFHQDIIGCIIYGLPMVDNSSRQTPLLYLLPSKQQDPQKPNMETGNNAIQRQLWD